MSSSSPRNANSRSKSSTVGRKRTQEVETGEEGLPESAGQAISAPEGATAAQLATSALDAAAGAEAEPRADEGPTGVDVHRAPEPEVESSPLGREILGAAEDMAGAWVPEPRPSAGAAPATPLEMLDETDLIEGAPAGVARAETSGLIVAGAAPPAMRDEEFLRRVVLPPLPQSSMSQGDAGGAYGEEDLSDKTVISDPPSPELLASWGRPAGTTARALQRRMKAPVELTTIELVGLLTGSALAGGLIGALFMAVPQPGNLQVTTPPAAITAPAQPVRAAAAAPVITPLPPAPRPTVEALPPPEERVEATDQPAASRARKVYRRSASARKAAKKEWVDPFEQ
jgi:hypothetical protein